MVRFEKGNLLEAPVDALVNAVNTVGVMGRGIALMFKERFPENFRAYASACRAGKVTVGRMFICEAGEPDGPRWIINFPTKEHWRKPARLEWVVSGLESLKEVIREKGIRSIALPPLGCGNGGLDWPVVKPLMIKALGQMEDVEVVIYEPTVEFRDVRRKGDAKNKKNPKP
jgi:O-acetyl-ADP-ribose deacetylase (regulator of RNase III)